MKLGKFRTMYTRVTMVTVIDACCWMLECEEFELCEEALRGMCLESKKTDTKQLIIIGRMGRANRVPAIVSCVSSCKGDSLVSQQY